MKKFLAIAFTSIMIFCLAACGGSDNPNSRPSPDDAYVPDPSLVYTAEFLVSCQQTDDAYDDFYYNSDFHCAIPGLKQKFIPQGVAYDEFTSSTFLTGYQNLCAGFSLRVRKSSMLLNDKGVSKRHHEKYTKCTTNHTYKSDKTK